MIVKFEDYDKEYVKSLIRDVTDFPKKGITFKDIQKVLMDPKAVKYIVNDVYDNIKHDNIDIVLGLDARGFLLGPMIAQKLGVGFAMARKKGKLPPPYIEDDYELEYGTNTITVSPEIVTDKLNVHIHDDLLATAGTLNVTIDLLKKLSCSIASISTIIELKDLNGREKLKGEKIYSFLRL